MRYIVALLAALFVGQTALEQGSTWVMRHYGKNEMRWAAERSAANALVHDGKGVLLIGSSVLLGVDPAQIEKEMPDWTVRRAVLVGTFHTDWDYALRRLYREGVKPDYVVLGGLPFQYYGETFRGDYLALHWLDRNDIPELSRRKGLDLTAETNLYFSSVNAFFALRDDIRNAFLGVAIPGHKVLQAGGANHRQYTRAQLEQIIGDNLSALDSRLRRDGAQLVVLRYPAPDMEHDWDIVKGVTASKGIPFVTAVESLPKDRFVDPYHLGEQGTAEFTTALGPALNEALHRLKAQ